MRIRSDGTVSRLLKDIPLPKMFHAAQRFPDRHIERGEKKASIETVVALCNAMEVSPAVLLQDSLSDAVMQSHLAASEENRALFSELMQVLREHNQKDNKYL